MLLTFLRNQWKFLNVFVISVVVLYCCAYYPVFVNFQNAPSNRVYLGLDEYPNDFTWNMTTIYQGYHGDWQSHLHYSSALPDSRSLLKIEYIVIGHIAKILSLHPLVAFHVSRFLISMVFLIGIGYIVFRTFHRLRQQMVALLMIFFGTGILTRAFYVTWGFVIDAQVFQRLTTSAIHYQLGGLLSLLSLYTFARFLDSQKKKRIYFNLSLGIGFLAVWINSPSMVFVMLAIGMYVTVYGLYQLVRFRNSEWIISTGLWVGVYSLFLVGPFLYVQHVRSVTWAPYYFMHTEKINYFGPSLIQYFLFMGIPYLLSVIGSLRAGKKGSTLVRMMITWIIIHPIGVFIIPKYLEFNTIRFFLTPYYVGFGILAVYGIDAIISFQKRLCSIKYSAWIASLVVLVLTGITSTEAYLHNFSQMRLEYKIDWQYMFGAPLSDHLNIAEWFASNAKSTDVILTHYYAGTIISAFSGRPVLMTHWMKLADPPIHYTLINSIESFYGMKMKRSQALEFLRTNSVRYVVFSHMEREFRWPVFTLDYDFLHPVYTVGDVSVIYEVMYN